MVKKQYIDADTFKGFKENQDKMIEILNHSMTSVSKDVKTMTKDFGTLKTNFATFTGEFSIMKRLVWWILGIIAFLVGAGLLAAVRG